MQCPSCNHEAPQADFGDPLLCPSCGVYYAKALAAKLRRETVTVSVSAPVAQNAKRKFPARSSLIGLVALTVAGYVFAAPYIAVYQIRTAAQAHDAEALEEHIDFPRVREGLKDQLNAVVMAKAKTELSDNPFAAFGMALAGAMIDKMVASYVTPAGIAELMKGEKPVQPGGVSKTPTGVDTAGAPQASNDSKVFANASYGYEGVSKFVVEVPSKDGGGPARFILRRDFISWRLTDVRLPLDG